MEYKRIEACPLDRTNRSRSGQCGSAGSCRMTRVNRTWASGARAMAVPGWPELAARGASMARPRMTLTPSCSRSSRRWRSASCGGCRSSAGNPIGRTTAGRGRRRSTGGPGLAGPEQGHRGRGSVHEVVPTHRTELTGGEEPAEGTGPTDRWSMLRRRGGPRRTVGCPGPLQVNTKAASAARPLEIRPSPRWAVRRVAPVEPDGAAQRYPVVDGHGPGGAVHADDVADKEVAGAGLGRSLVDEPADEQAVGSRPATSAGPGSG